jgi:hypothetical protein
LKKGLILSILLILFTLLDIATTHYALTHFEGIIVEGNPIVADEVMTSKSVITKMALSLICVVCLNIATIRFKRIIWFMLIAILPLVGAVINNTILIVNYLII